MSLFISSLNSGSNGNCYYVGNHQEAVLIDAGISCRETEKRMKRLGLDMEKVKAIIVSHEHSDHIRGIVVLAKKFRLPVYITRKTLIHSRLNLDPDLIRSFSASEQIMIGEMRITAFPKYHDAVEPHSFVVECDDTRVGVFTDIGEVCENVVNHFQTCHAVFLETNYDEELLESGNYPFFLKNRIKGGRGHLSNRQALALFLDYKSPYLTHLLLSHLSKNNNCPLVAQRTFTDHAGDVEIILAPREKETLVYEITGVRNPTFSEVSHALLP